MSLSIYLILPWLFLFFSILLNASITFMPVFEQVFSVTKSLYATCIFLWNWSFHRMEISHHPGFQSQSPLQQCHTIECCIGCLHPSTVKNLFHFNAGILAELRVTVALVMPEGYYPMQLRVFHPFIKQICSCRASAAKPFISVRSASS